MTFFDLEAATIDGDMRSLQDFEGKVLLVVNTASQCGSTPQYAGLEQLWQTYKDQGLVVLGFPSNDFGAQEPGSASEIKAFCTSSYGVTFPMFEKVKIKSKAQGQSPVYKFLSAKYGEPQWNFHKYLVGRDGQVRRAFPTKVVPEAPELKAAIEAALRAS